MENTTVSAMDGEMLYGWIEQWMDVYKKRKVQTSTYQGYRCAINLIKTWIDNIPLSKIKEWEIQEKFNLLADFGYSKSQLHTIRSVLAQAFGRASYNGKMNMNPAEHLYIPINAPEKKIDALTLDEEQRVLKACQTDLHGDHFIFLLNTGLRREEFCNLKWSDYDAAEGILYIRKSKTAAGVRAIPLLPICSTIIAIQPKFNEHIFNSCIKQPITPCSLKKTYLRLRKTAEVPTLTNHVCRHTFATRLLEAGVDPKAISALLGHVSVAFTLNRYATAQMAYLKEQLKNISRE